MSAPVRGLYARFLAGSVAFVLSTFVGITGSVVQDANALFVWSGVIFAIAFAGLGFEMWTSQTGSSRSVDTAGG